MLPVYQLFLSSPGDVVTEQKLAEQVVMEFNRAWSRFFSIHVEALRYETHVYPRAASDPQAAVNEAIGDQYDLYVGLMWKRFGTPTPRSGSGTAEEFERAIARHREQPEEVQVAFYFRDVSDVDRAEAAKEIDQIESFRNRMGASGTLWWGYRDPEDFEALFRIHLAYHIQRWLQGKPDLLQRIGAERSGQPGPKITSPQDPAINEALDSITAVMSRFAEEMAPHQIVLSHRHSTHVNEAHDAFHGTIQALRNYTLGLDRTLPRFAKAFAAAFRGPGQGGTCQRF